ncbi:MAG: DegT/DnrJ/EryC1/StrS family aminotransferase, partial [Actinobacteria bacterium]|nr:DegT/DnrJ/EryC1/StrS family aminotransferase [Actinomycetota bacterium]
NKRVAAILVVHQMGFPCDLKLIISLAKKYNLPVIEDAACAIGSEISFNNGKSYEKIGKPHGDIACFSFHPRKLVTCGDGGMITTDNINYSEKVRLLRQHYMNVPDTTRHESKEVIFETYPGLGFNFRMTDIQAAIGIEQLNKIGKILKKRRELAQYYSLLLKKIPWISITNIQDNIKPNWQSYPIKIDARINQKSFMQYLLNKGVATRRGIMNTHEETPYKNMGWSLANSEITRNNTVLLPLYAEITHKDIKYIVNTISKFKNSG